MLQKLIFTFAFFFVPGLALCQPPSTPPPPPTTTASSRIMPQITHVGIVVKDIKHATAQTLSSLGLPASAVVADQTFVVHGGLYKEKRVDFTVQIAIVETGNLQIEYLEPLTGPSPYADALKDGLDAVVHHLAFVVPSIDDRLAQARHDNPDVQVVLDAPIGQVGRYVYVSGVLPGTLVEFIEMGQAHQH